MRTNHQTTVCLFWAAFIALLIPACSKADLEFKKHVLVSEGGAKLWWARSHADVNGDGLLDFFVVNNCGGGGWLAWYETRPDFGKSVQHIIADSGPDGGTFAAGDLASADIDGDGDIDVLGPVSPGEWGGADQPTKLYWYENPSWEAHYIDELPCLVKDFDLIDLNGDKKPDLVATTHVARKLYVYRQDNPENWSRVAEVYVEQLHEGQHVGDVDGDGDVDAISTGFWFVNPGGDMTATWSVRNIDPYWNSDDGYTWEHNATKIICEDIDGDDRDEVFISCSEKFRNRVAWYDLNPECSDRWVRHEIGLNAYAHTLQVGDMDSDGDFDVLSGNNGDQGFAHASPVIIFFRGEGEEDWKQWQQQQVLTMKGAYNSYIGDVEGDGDLDFFRLEGHEGTFYELWENLLIDE